jgi:hypothetical protein
MSEHKVTPKQVTPEGVAMWQGVCICGWESIPYFSLANVQYDASRHEREAL